MYVRLLVIVGLMDAKHVDEVSSAFGFSGWWTLGLIMLTMQAYAFAKETAAHVQSLNRRSMDHLAAKVYFYLARCAELLKQEDEARPYVFPRLYTPLSSHLRPTDSCWPRNRPPSCGTTKTSKQRSSTVSFATISIPACTTKPTSSLAKSPGPKARATRRARDTSSTSAVSAPSSSTTRPHMNACSMPYGGRRLRTWRQDSTRPCTSTLSSSSCSWGIFPSVPCSGSPSCAKRSCHTFRLSRASSRRPADLARKS